MKENPWKTLSSEEVYSNAWISVQHDEVITPGKTRGIYGKVHFKNIAIGIIPLDEKMNTWLVGQYRYVLDKYCWEIPEGGCLVGTDPLLSAKRELKEETGLKANRWDKLMELHTSNSVCDEYGIVYVARELSQGDPEPEDTEDLQLRKLPFAEVLAMVMKGEITDSVSVAGILKLAHILKQ